MVADWWEGGEGKGLSECGKASCSRSSRALSIRHVERLEPVSRVRMPAIDNSLARNLSFRTTLHRNQPKNAYQLLVPEGHRGAKNFAARRRRTHNGLFQFLAVAHGILTYT